MMTEGKEKSKTFDRELRLLFAVGGEVLAFYELKTLAQLMHKHVGEFPEITDEQLRDALGECEHVTTSNGNYFTCNDDGLYKLAMQFLGNPEHGKIVPHIARSLPYQSTDGLTNPARLARDVRNTLFAKDGKQHKKYMDILNREQPSDFLNGKPYWFLANGDYIGWLETLPMELLSVCIRQLVPYMIQRLKPMDGLLAMAMPKFQQLYVFARFPLIDALIATGRFDEAENRLHAHKAVLWQVMQPFNV